LSRGSWLGKNQNGREEYMENEAALVHTRLGGAQDGRIVARRQRDGRAPPSPCFS
jgi:hypothetical protein